MYRQVSQSVGRGPSRRKRRRRRRREERTRGKREHTQWAIAARRTPVASRVRPALHGATQGRQAHGRRGGRGGTHGESTARIASISVPTRRMRRSVRLMLDAQISRDLLMCFTATVCAPGSPRLRADCTFANSPAAVDVRNQVIGFELEDD